jgi:AcrR family transcriptional regulator
MTTKREKTQGAGRVNGKPADPPTPDQKTMSVREHIIECATELLGREGYGALTVSAICKLANVSAPSLYWHFGSKEGLLAEILKQALRRDAEAFLSIDVSGIKRYEAFELYLAALRRIIVTERPNNWVILSSLSEARHAAPEIVEIIAEARRRQIDFNAEQLRQWGMKNDCIMVHLWLSYCNYISLLYQDTKNEELVDEALASFKRAYFLMIGALGEKCASEEGFRQALLQIGYQPAAFDQDDMTISAAGLSADASSNGSLK